MAKITFPNKLTNATSPVAANKQLTSANVNEIKESVNALYDQQLTILELSGETYALTGLEGTIIAEGSGGAVIVNDGGAVPARGIPYFFHNTMTADNLTFNPQTGVDGVSGAVVIGPGQTLALSSKGNGNWTVVVATKVDAYVDGTQHNVIVAVTGACDADGFITVNFAVASGERPALASAEFIGGCAGPGSNAPILAYLDTATISGYKVQFYDINDGPAGEGTSGRFTVLGVTA